MTSLTFLSLAGLLLPFAAASGNASGTLVKDAACQAKMDSLSTDAILNNPCDSSSSSSSSSANTTGTCPATCAAKIENVTAVCTGKNYEKTTTTASGEQKVVKPFSEGKIDLIFLMEMFASGEACKNLLFDKGYEATTTCELAYTFAAKEVFFSPWCDSTSGGKSETTCHANCQKMLDKVFSTCNDGDVYDTDDAGVKQTYSSTLQPAGLAILGPSTCSYTDGASTKPGAASFSHQAGYSIITLLAVAPTFLMM